MPDGMLINLSAVPANGIDMMNAATFPLILHEEKSRPSNNDANTPPRLPSHTLAAQALTNSICPKRDQGKVCRSTHIVFTREKCSPLYGRYQNPGICTHGEL